MPGPGAGRALAEKGVIPPNRGNKEGTTDAGESLGVFRSRCRTATLAQAVVGGLWPRRSSGEPRAGVGGADATTRTRSTVTVTLAPTWCAGGGLAAVGVAKASGNHGR